MRLWIAGLLALGMLVGIGAVVSAAPRKVKASRPAGMVYVCTSCGVGSMKLVRCPVCKGAMGRLATYACMKCQISSDAPGICPNCREPMPSVAKQYRHCADCGYFYSKSKNACPVCARRRKMARR